MRRSHLAVTALLVGVLAGLGPAPGVTAQPDPAAPAEGRGRPRDEVRAPHPQVADELDLTTVIPALQDAFGERYGGYWIEVRRHDDLMHVAVVGATPADGETVAQLTARHPRVVTDAVTHGYDDLLAAQDEIALSLDPAAGHFTVDVDVETNSVVVSTESSDATTTAAVARDAARRGAVRPPRAPGAPPAGSPAAAPSRAAASSPPAADLAAAVRVEPAASIAVEPVGATRNTFPPYESGLYTRIAYGGRLVGCTTGFLFRNGYGVFGSTAGHCGRVNDGVLIGPHIVDVIRANGYQGYPWVMADTSLISLSARGWAYWPEIHGAGHRGITAKYRNAQITRGLRLCFEGVTSDSGNCGYVVRANQWMCCDAGGHSFYYSCIRFQSRPGDSGGPVYFPTYNGRAIAAGMVSSSVTVNGTLLTCFSTVESMEYILGSRLITW